MHKARIIFAVVATVLVIVVAGGPPILTYVAEAPTEAARAALVDRGHAADDLGLLSAESASPLYSAGTATVRFSSPAGNGNEPETIEVELRRPVFSAAWEVVRVVSK